MEHTRTSFLPASRLLGVEEPHVTSSRHHDYIPYLGPRTRTGYGMHYPKIQRLRLHCNDVANANCHGPEKQVG
jgi:hypothetical protein